MKCNNSIHSFSQPVVFFLLFISLSETYDKFSISLTMSTFNGNEINENTTVRRSSTSSDTSQRPSTTCVNGTRPKSPARKRSQWEIELEKQQQLMTRISIDGIPIQNSEDVRALFFQLCAHLNFPISHKDLNDIHRDTNKSILVNLKTIGLKKNMFQAWRKASLLSSIKFLGRKLSPRVRSGRISITDAKTSYYAMLYKIAQNAVDDKIFDNCEICIHGLEITCDYGRKKSIVLSLSDLDDLIDRYSKH